MKKSGRSFRPLLLAMAALGTAPLMAQTVTVPPTCNVVVPGTGGVAGLGGIVGNGGIVTMADPFDIAGAGGNFVFAGGAPLGWSLLGDISVQVAFNQAAPVPGANPPVQAAGAVGTVNIQSYNKVLRVSEVPTPTLARSKGRVTVSYSIAPCNNSMSFDIYKVWTTPAPPIVGPDCWGTGLITFSVDQVSSDNGLDAIGFDQYYWRLTNGAAAVLGSAAFYTSADRSSITIDQSTATFTTWLGGGGPYTIQTCFGRANPWDGGTAANLIQLTAGTTCVTKVINAAPAAPVYSPAIPTCVATGTTSIGPFLTTNLPGHTYTWSVPCAWTVVTSGPAGEDLTITGMDANSCTLTLTDVGPCGSNIYTYNIRRTFASNLLTPTPVCVSSPGSFTATLPANALNNVTCWNALPAGWTFGPSNPPNNSTRVINVPAGVAPGAYTITAFSCSCPGNTSITVNVRPQTPSITSGPTCVPSGGGPNQTWVSSTPSGVCATCFTWSTSMGMTQVAPTNDNTGVFTPTGTANGTVSVFASLVASCPSATASITVNRYPVVTQPACLNSGSPTNGAVFTSTQAGTVWSFPAGLTASTPPAGTTATINVIGTPGTYASTATANGCTTNFNVVIAAVPGLYTTNVDETVIPGSSLVYTTFISGNQYRLWDCTANAPATGAFGLFQGATSSYQLSGSSAGSYAIEVDPSPAGGCTFRSPCVTTIHNQLPVAPGHFEQSGDAKSLASSVDGSILISPNPNNGAFTLNVLREFSEGTVLLYDAKGTRVGSTTRILPGANTLNEDRLAPGVYRLRIEIDGKVENRSIVITQE